LPASGFVTPYVLLIECIIYSYCSSSGTSYCCGIIYLSLNASGTAAIKLRI
jgi:hypothetical protein